MSKPLVFVLDDHEDTTELLTMCLSMRGYPVRCATDALDALKQLEHMKTPCVFFLDHNLPGCDPSHFMALAERINPPVHIVLMTGHNAEEKALHLGIKYYIQKPFDPAVVITLVDKLAVSCTAA
jgi:CheY-like chemotaxis protein